MQCQHVAPEQLQLPVILKLSKANSIFWSHLITGALSVFLIVILIAGLRPYANYSNEWVSFNDADRYTVFKHYGLATGSLSPEVKTAISQHSLTISIAAELRKAPDNRFQVLAQIDSPGSLDPLIIGQWQTSLIVMSGRDYRNKNSLPRLSANLSAHTHSFTKIEILLTGAMTELKVNGVILKKGPFIPFDVAPTRISIGNSPDGTHGWTGNLRLFELRSATSDFMPNQYSFDNNILPKIQNTGSLKHYLTIPKPGHFPERQWLGALQFDQLFHNNLHDVIVNLLGFIPLGFLISISIHMNQQRKSLLKKVTIKTICITTFLGTLLSLTIETLQVFIAGRSPHVHDLLLNSLGTLAGALSLYTFYKIGLIVTLDDSECALAKDLEN